MAILISGCGTLKHGGMQNLDISSNPVGAEVTVNGTEYGITPVTVELPRRNNHTISVSLAGYENFQIIVDRKWSKWAIGNILLGGPIGLIIDHSTGGMYRLDHSQIVAQLESRGMADVKVDDSTVYVTVAMEAQEDWEYIGSLAADEVTEQ
ncbi:MAG: PEGA domain-containing protein [Bacteroidota bacterium]